MALWLDSAQYLQKAAVDHLLGLASTTMPTCYLALLTGSPGEAGALAGLEPSGGNYGRKEITSLMSAFVLGTGVAQLNSFLQFALPSAAWGTLTHIAFVDVITTGAGNVLWSAELDTPIAMGTGASPVQFTAGQIQIAIAANVLTNAARKAIGDHFLGKSAFTAPTACDFHLFTASPGAAGSFADEADYGGYAAFDDLTAEMTAAVLSGANAGISLNANEVAFPSCSSGSNIVTYTGVSDGAGNLLTFNPLRHARVVNAGDAGPTFAPSTIAVGMT